MAKIKQTTGGKTFAHQMCDERDTIDGGIWYLFVALQYPVSYLSKQYLAHLTLKKNLHE